MIIPFVNLPKQSEEEKKDIIQSVKSVLKNQGRTCDYNNRMQTYPVK